MGMDLLLHKYMQTYHCGFTVTIKHVLGCESFSCRHLETPSKRH